MTAREFKTRLETAFIQGAKWWEYEKEGATMWPSEQERAAKEAERRSANGTLGVERFPRDK